MGRFFLTIALLMTTTLLSAKTTLLGRVFDATLGEYLWRTEPQMSGVSANWVFGTQAHLGQKLLKDRLEIAVAVYNPHSRVSTFKTRSDTPTYYQWASNSTVSRCIRLSVSYNFGKQGLYVKRTASKRDDGGDNIGGGSKGVGM